jgi:hypothetical protein
MELRLNPFLSASFYRPKHIYFKNIQNGVMASCELWFNLLNEKNGVRLLWYYSVKLNDGYFNLT